MKRTVITTRATILIREEQKKPVMSEITVLGGTTEIVTRNAKKSLGFKSKKDGEKRTLFVIDEERHATLYEIDDNIFFKYAEILDDKIITDDEITDKENESL